MENLEREQIPPTNEQEEPKEETPIINPIPEVTFPNDGKPNQKAELPDIEALVNEKVDLILGKVVDKLNDRHRREMDELKSKLNSLDDKLPKTITPRRVEGYYDFNNRTNEFLNEAAKNDYSKAKETLDYVRTIFK